MSDSSKSERKEYKFGSMKLGQTRADLTYVDSGEKMENKMVRSLTERATLTREMLDEVSGASLVDPSKIRPLHGKILAEVIPVVDEGQGQGLGTLVAPGLSRHMQRHRALTPEGKVIFFRRGAGELMRLGGAGHEAEWIILEPKDIIGELDGIGIRITGRYVLFKRLPTPQREEGRIIQLDDATRKQIWYLGEVWALPEKSRGQELLHIFQQIIVDVSNHTMIFHMGQMFIAAPYDDVMGVYSQEPVDEMGGKIYEL